MGSWGVWRAGSETWCRDWPSQGGCDGAAPISCRERVFGFLGEVAGKGAQGVSSASAQAPRSILRVRTAPARRFLCEGAFRSKRR